MAEHAKKKVNFLFILTAILLTGCANQLPPGGGAVDLVPPVIEETYPKNGTTNFKNKYIEIDFSKFIVHGTFNDALFISPALNGQAEYDWTNKSVKVYFPGKLRQNVTYVVSVGTGVQDYNNHNHMAQSYSFAFSTGSKIDRGSISGRVFTDKPSGIMMFAYLKGDSAINPMKFKPDYISQTGNGGDYKLLGLKSGEYRIFAVRDQYMDLIYQPEQDEIGIPFEDIKLTEKDSSYSGLNFFITKFDTVKPRLINAVMTDRNHVLLKFSQEIDTSTVKPSNFILIDSTSGKTVKPVYAFKGNTKSGEMVLAVDSAFPVKDEAFVEVKTIKDLFGNIFHSDNTALTLSDKADTTKPGIFKTSPQNGSTDADFIGQVFTFYFNDGFDSLEAEKGISFTDTSGASVPYRIHFIDNATFTVKPDYHLKANNYYFIKLNLLFFRDIAGNKYDSVYKYKFKTINGLDFTGISGKITGADLNNKPILVLENLSNEEKKYKQPVEDNLNFEFNRVLPGNYRLWCFYDKNGNGKYDYGKAYPYKPSERFWVYPDTLNLKARWIKTNLIFNINNR